MEITGEFYCPTGYVCVVQVSSSWTQDFTRILFQGRKRSNIKDWKFEYVWHVLYAWTNVWRSTTEIWCTHFKESFKVMLLSNSMVWLSSWAGGHWWRVGNEREVQGFVFIYPCMSGDLFFPLMGVFICSWRCIQGRWDLGGAGYTNIWPLSSTSLLQVFLLSPVIQRLPGAQSAKTRNLYYTFLVSYTTWTAPTSSDTTPFVLRNLTLPTR